MPVPRFVDELASRVEAEVSSHDARAYHNDLVDTAFMQLAIQLSHENVQLGGGPFGAVVTAGQRVVAAGVNCVLTSGLSIAHAEIVTLTRAQRQLKRTGLAHVHAPLTLYSSTEPCCQCFGAVVWSGVARLVCGARSEDAEAIGFDEGPKPSDWSAELARRGIAVQRDLCREAARNVLQTYVERGGPIYGAGKDWLPRTPKDQGP